MEILQSVLEKNESNVDKLLLKCKSEMVFEKNYNTNLDPLTHSDVSMEDIFMKVFKDVCNRLGRADCLSQEFWTVSSRGLSALWLASKLQTNRFSMKVTYCPPPVRRPNCECNKYFLFNYFQLSAMDFDLANDCRGLYWP